MNRFFRFISGLPAGDKAIAGFLALLFLCACLVSLAALARSFQVTVPAHGGTLHEGVVGSPRFVNPLLAASDSDRDLVQLAYAGLMGHDADGALVPVLAESYQVSDDGTQYTFTLRQGAAFSDGSPVTADDVVYTIEKAQDPALKSPAYASWSNIRVEALDARTVRFTLPKAYAPFLEDATLGILPKHLWQDVSDEEFPFASLNTRPVGAGPFAVRSVSRDSDGSIKEYELAAFDEYALGRPYLSHIRLSFYADQQGLQAAYAAGEIDSAYGIASPDARTAPYARIFAVFFNPAKDEALDDAGVRAALSLAIDRTKLAEDLLGGYATPTMGPLPAGSGVPPLPLPEESSRLEDARTALEDAGYEYASTTNLWMKDGELLSVTLTTANVPELKAVAGQVQDDWRALGIKVELELHDSSTITQAVIRPRAYSALLFGEVIGTSPDLYAFWAGSERADPGLNIADYEDEDVDALLSEARSETDPGARLDTLSEIQETIASAYPAAFLYTPQFLYAVPERIRGIALSSVSAPSDRFWGIAGWYRYTEHVWPFFAPASSPGTNS